MEVRYGLLVVSLYFALGPAFAQDSELVYFDPLPENAEELARAKVEEYLTQRYPGETIVIGEAIPLYVYENEIKALDFIVELDGKEPLTFDKILDIYTNLDECNRAFQSYKDTIFGNEAWERVHNGEDEEHNRLFNNLLKADYLSDSIMHLVVAFINSKAELIGYHKLGILLRTYITLSDEQLVRHVGFGLIPGESYVLIANILKNEDTGELEWYTDWDFTYSFTDTYPITAESPLNWTIFRSAFLDRGREDIPPVNEY
jgi:hypothetical protein